MIKPIHLFIDCLLSQKYINLPFKQYTCTCKLLLLNGNITENKQEASDYFYLTSVYVHVLTSTYTHSIVVGYF